VVACLLFIGHVEGLEVPDSVHIDSLASCPANVIVNIAAISSYSKSCFVVCCNTKLGRDQPVYKCVCLRRKLLNLATCYVKASIIYLK